jgi:uncharacterized iron-regulated membrane protein
MSDTVKRQHQARILRFVRKIHRFTGLLLVFFLLFLASSGLLLGWKKHAGDLILPGTATGTTSDLSRWLPLDSLHYLALQAFREKKGPNEVFQVDRVDVRPDQGVVKFTFKSSLFEVQLDGASGALLKTGNRYSDLVEKIHDGSILDQVLGINGGYIKLMYTSILGIGLLIFSVTGFWLWYGPRRMRH